VIAAIQEQINLTRVNEAVPQESMIRLSVSGTNVIVTSKSKFHKKNSSLSGTSKQKRTRRFGAVPPLHD
jgi:hypothetical protein